MRLVIHDVWTATVPNLRKWAPDDSDVFCEIVVVSIGTGSRSRGADDFTLWVATPKGLMSRAKDTDVVVAGPVLVLAAFDDDVLWDWLTKTVAQCEAETWDASVDRLRRWFDWEFDYRP